MALDKYCPGFYCQRSKNKPLRLCVLRVSLVDFVVIFLQVIFHHQGHKASTKGTRICMFKNQPLAINL